MEFSFWENMLWRYNINIALFFYASIEYIYCKDQYKWLYKETCIAQRATRDRNMLSAGLNYPKCFVKKGKKHIYSHVSNQNHKSKTQNLIHIAQL